MTDQEKLDMQQMIAALLPQAGAKEKDRAKPKRLIPIPKTLQLKIHTRRYWGELFCELPEGYDLADLEGDIEDMAEDAPIHESRGHSERQKRGRGRSYED